MSSPVRFNKILCTLMLAVSFAMATAMASDSNSQEENFQETGIVQTDSVKIYTDNPNEKLDFNGHRLILDNSNNSVTFELIAAGGLYQFYLEGFDSGWTTARTSNYKEYTNLPAGKYLLKSRFIGNGTNSIEITPLSVRVLPPWYSSRTAILFYFLFAALLIRFFYDQLNLRFSHVQYSLEQIINKRTEDLIIEKEKTEALLANVLPKNTASEIMEKGKATKIKYNFVTVLFSDIQGFTKIAEEMNPEILIDELDKFFFYFDSVVEKLRIEKIKTIGDAYMCAGGIPEKNRTNPVEVILAALEMKAYMTRLKQTSELEGMKFWDIRIGIHTGTVVAGVVGQKKLSYDIWGDTVNTASRMESSGEAGKINISGTTYEFVKDFFKCEYRGKMPVKYKGELEMYFVEGIITELADENGGPNRAFIVKMQKIKLQDIEEMILKMFDDEAPPNLYFHNSSFVRSMCNQVELLSTAETLPEEEFINVKLAAVFLFTGYISDYEKPMEASIRLTEEILPVYGFDQVNLESVTKIITNSYNEIQNTLSDQILHDAKYDYLGRVDYLKLTERLLRERTEYGKHTDKNSWDEMLKNQLEKHEFQTATARMLRSVPAADQKKGLGGISI
jgi:adenylate cyclase